MTKQELRAQMRMRCAAVTATQAMAQGEAALGHLQDWSCYRQARRVMAYVSLPGELDTTAILDAILADGKQLALPRCGDGRHMDAVPVPAWRSLARGRYGLLEPARGIPAMDPACMDLVLVPGMAFDVWGGRLGRGAGYYDRFLSGIPAVTAGLALLEQIVPAVPLEPHDGMLGYIVTAQGIAPAQHRGGQRE